MHTCLSMGMRNVNSVATHGDLKDNEVPQIFEFWALSLRNL